MRDSLPRRLNGRRRYQPLPDTDLAVALGQLSVLIEGGVALTDAVRSLAEFESRPRMARVWGRLADDIERGQLLSTAIGDAGLARHPDVLALLAAAESDGSLGNACHTLEVGLELRIDYARRMRAALMYPLIAGVALVLACVFLLWRVVPALSLASSEQAVPWHAVPLIRISTWLQALSPGAGLAAVLIVALLGTVAGLTPAGGRLRRAIPSVARSDRLIQLASYADIVRRLRQHGAPLVDAMSSAEACIACPALHTQLVQARQQVRFGKRLAASLADALLVPPLVCRLLAVGETTGALDASLQRVSSLLDSEARCRLERLQTLAPVVVLGLVGGLLLWVIASVVLPVYEQALSGASVQ